MMKIFDLAISYKWIYDKEFIDLMEEIFQRDGLTTFIIYDVNVAEVIELLSKKKIGFRAYLDRASDEDINYEPIVQILSKRKTYIFNPHSKVEIAVNKSIIHDKLLKLGFRLPKTFILPTFEKSGKLNLTQGDLSKIDTPFIIKPAYYTGGGEGVVHNGTSLEQIQKEREKFHYESYLVQEIIHPKIISGRRAWFRVFWAFDKVIPTWWDDITHLYEPVTAKDIKKYKLLELESIITKLAKIVDLDYFSTEIALNEKDEFVLIDYVNDQCDMRLKSNHADGVPDEVVADFINRMKTKVTSL